MKIEARASDGDACPTCGAHPLVTTKKGVELSADIADYLAREWADREAELRKLLAAEHATNEASVRAETQKLRDMLAASAAHLADTRSQLRLVENKVDNRFRASVLGAAPSKWHPIRKRRHGKLTEHVDTVLADLRLETRKV